MKKLAWFAASLARVILSAWAAQRTATLYVPGTTCPARPSTGKRALTRVGGVSKAASTMRSGRLLSRSATPRRT